MESDERYYRRRAIQELAAARRAVTESAQARRRSLAETYLRRLSELTGSDEMFLMAGTAATLSHLEEYA
jgi:ribosomal protein L18E